MLGARVAQWVEHLPLAGVVIPTSWDQAPLWAPHQGGVCLSVFLCPSPLFLFMLSLSLSEIKINKIFYKKNCPVKKRD